MAMSLSAWVRQFRERFDVSQRELAERAGISVRTVMRVENDAQYSPRESARKQLLEAMGLALPLADGTPPEDYAWTPPDWVERYIERQEVPASLNIRALPLIGWATRFQKSSNGAPNIHRVSEIAEILVDFVEDLKSLRETKRYEEYQASSRERYLTIAKSIYAAKTKDPADPRLEKLEKELASAKSGYQYWKKLVQERKMREEWARISEIPENLLPGYTIKEPELHPDLDDDEVPF